MNRPQMKPTRTGDIGSPDTNPPVKPSPKTVEELMRPRVIVENTWPGCPFEVGDILIKDGDYYCLVGDTIWSGRIDATDVKPYPYLMRPLQWWEERKPEDMPEHVKSKSACWVNDTNYEKGQVVKISSINQKAHDDLSFFIPAAEQQYNEYLKTKKP